MGLGQGRFQLYCGMFPKKPAVLGANQSPGFFGLEAYVVQAQARTSSNGDSSVYCQSNR